MKTTNYSRSRMRGKLSSTVLKTSTGSDTCAEFIQGQNKKEALRILTVRVNDLKRNKELKAYGDSRKQQLGSGGRGDKVRTYNFIRSEIVDHVLNKATTNVKAFMKGDFSILFGA